VCVCVCVCVCVRARARVRVCVCTCIVFASIILNVREDISILVGKQTNSTAIYVLSSAHMLVPLHISTAIVRDLAERPEKNAVASQSLRLLTGGTCHPKLSRDTNTIFQSIRKIRHFPIGASVDREVSFGLNRF